MKLPNGLKIGAEVLLGATIIIMLYICINEISTGNQAGMLFLLPLAIFVVFMWLGWIRPLETGVGLALLGIIVFTFPENIVIDSIAWRTIGAPTLITGFLLLGSGWKFREAN